MTCDTFIYALGQLAVSSSRIAVPLDIVSLTVANSGAVI
jgi:hypothetical protein